MGDRIVKFVEMRFEPTVFQRPYSQPLYELKIMVQVNDRQFSDVAVFPEDDIESILDLIFDLAVKKMKAAIREKLDPPQFRSKER